MRVIRLLLVLFVTAGVAAAQNKTESDSLSNKPTVARWVVRKDFALPRGNSVSVVFHEKEQCLYLLTEVSPESSDGALYKQSGHLFQKVGPGVSIKLPSGFIKAEKGQFKEMASSTLTRYVLWYDSQRGVIRLYGGVALQEPNAALYEWCGSAWTNIAVYAGNCPGPLGLTAAYDSTRHQLMAFGGAHLGVALIPGGPAPAYPSADIFILAEEREWKMKKQWLERRYALDSLLVYHPKKQEFFCFGGALNWWRLGDFAPIVDTVTTNHAAWIKPTGDISPIGVKGSPSPRCCSKGVYCPDQDMVIVSGGVTFKGDNATIREDLSDTYGFKDSAWVFLSSSIPSPPSDTWYPLNIGMVYYPPEKCVLLFWFPPLDSEASPVVYELKFLSK